MEKNLKTSSISIIAVLSIVLLMCTKEPQLDSLVNTEWEVWSITAPNSDFILISPTPYKVNFQKDNIYTMRLDVNSCGSTYNIENNNIHIEPIYCTKICCDKSYADTLRNILLKIDAYKIIGEDLELISSNRIINLTKVKN